MSRTSLHRPRRPRVVWDRPATGTRLFPYPLPPTAPLHIPHYKRCPKAHRLRLSSDQSLSHRPGPPDRLWKVPGHCPACPFQRQLPDRRPSHRAQWIRPRRIQGPKSPGLRQRPSRPCRTTPSSLSENPFPPGEGSCSHRLPPPLRVAERQCSRAIVHRTPPSLPSERPCHTATAESPRPHISVWPGTSGGRDCPTPRSPRVSSTSSQKHGAVAKPASMWNIRCGGQHPSVQASPSSCATVRDLPSPPLPSLSVPSPVGATGWSPWGGARLLSPRHPRKEPAYPPTPTTE